MAFVAAGRGKRTDAKIDGGVDVWEGVEARCMAGSMMSGDRTEEYRCVDECGSLHLEKGGRISRFHFRQNL